MSHAPNIYDYIDYRRYLADWRANEKAANPGLTHEYLCSKLGQRNRTYFSDIETGRKQIGPEVLDRLVKLLQLKGTDARYFRALVNYGKPSSVDEREFWFEQIVCLNNTPRRLLDKDTYGYYKQWYHASIRALLDTVDTDGDCDLIASRLTGRVTKRQVQQSIALLSRLGLIAPNRKGHLKPTDKVITTGDAARGEVLRQNQLANLDLLREIVSKDKPGTHDSSQVTLSLSSAGFKRVIRRVRQFRSEILSIAHKDEEQAERVYKIALHVYPESKGKQDT